MGSKSECRTWSTFLLRPFIMVLLARTLRCDLPSLDASQPCSLASAPLPLLRWNLGPDKSRVLRIQSVNETLQVLSELEGEVVVVSVVGPYRTGKSFLLNQLVPHEPGNLTFKVGDTIKPETEEVTMVIIPPCASQGQYRYHVFLDTPGLFAPNRASIFDSQLLAVLNLVSNVVLYNSVGVIDRAAVEKLSFAVETAFAMSYFEEHEQVQKISRPHLVWVVQNFHLDMSLDGTKIDGNSWINKLLTQVDESNNGTSKISQQFHTFFSSLDAVVLPFPVDKVCDHDKALETL
eukprot:766411-Hanusia_phi.AAC.7